MIDLNQIEQDAAQATPGPWSSFIADAGDDHWWIESDADGGYPVGATNASRADVQHIANCDPQTVIALVRAVRAAMEYEECYVGSFMEPFDMEKDRRAGAANLAFLAALEPFRPAKEPAHDQQ